MPSAGTGGESASIASAGGMRGLLGGLNPAAGTITIARDAYPPLTLPVGGSATITRDGSPARLSDLETGSRTVVPDFILVTTTAGASGSPMVTRIKATSRDHYWYGHLTGIDPSSVTIAVTRADGQRHTFYLDSRTNVVQFGGGNVGWNALQVGGVVEVDWIPGDSPRGASVLDAHSVVLNKPYEGILIQPPVHH